MSVSDAKSASERSSDNDRAGDRGAAEAAAEAARDMVEKAVDAQRARETVGQALAQSGVAQGLSQQIAGSTAQSYAAGLAGQAAVAVPELAGAKVVQAQQAATAPALPEISLPGALRAATPAGLAVAASIGMQHLVGLARQQRVVDAGATLGLDMTTVEGVLAANAYASARETMSHGFGGLQTGLDYSRVEVNGPTREAAARAVAQNEFANPGDWHGATMRRDPSARDRVQGAIDVALNGLASGAAAPDVSAPLDIPEIVVENRGLPEAVPEIAPDGRPVQPAPEGRGLPTNGPPGTWVVGPRGDRPYGEDGRPATDIDWGHDHGQGRPHAHDWDGGTRQPGRPVTEDETFSGEARGEDGTIDPEEWTEE